MQKTARLSRRPEKLQTGLNCPAIDFIYLPSSKSGKKTAFDNRIHNPHNFGNLASLTKPYGMRYKCLQKRCIVAKINRRSVRDGN